MNIIIPLGGKGERFKNKYNKPKPLIQIFEKCMINYVIDNLNLSNNDKVFIIYNKKLDNDNFKDYIYNKYPFIHLIQINDTIGASETLYLGIDIIINNYEYHTKTIILDCDTFYTEDILTIFKNTNENLVFYRKNYHNNPIYSYIQLDISNNITNIKEKEKISNNANTGAYAFNNIHILFDYCKYILDNNITFNNEPYISCIISEMIQKGFNFKGYQLTEKYVFSLGTPNEVETYIDNTYAYLFDLDGTLVITDEIYYEVWFDILFNYNIILTKEIFNNYILGNNDNYVKQTLLKDISIPLEELSNIKDTMFIQKINKLQIIDGVYDILNTIKINGHKICIVTNCNKLVANEIVKYIKINHFVDFIISNDDCVLSKPNSEPYLTAIKRYNISNDKCIIFEDSKTGLISARGVNPRLLIGITTNYDNNILINIGADYSIINYLNFDIDYYLCSVYINSFNYFKKLIHMNYKDLNIQDIIIETNKLKGGFIADIISYKLITNDNTYSHILKYEIFHDNNLHQMARQLKLYEREYYFYTNIAKEVNIKIAKFDKLLINNNNKVIGIILENLFDKKYVINLNLNNEKIEVSLKIVNRMALLHSKFWNKDLKTIFPKLEDYGSYIFKPFLFNFITDRYKSFKQNWFHLFNEKQIEICNKIYENFDNIQSHFLNNTNNITFIHGDIKSPNIFYDINNDYEPYFIDWQHCAIGKGCQDLIFFIIESFAIENSIKIFNILKEYYYKQLLENKILNYSYQEYENDLYYSICYMPFFTSIWFGTIPTDELIDKNFPYTFISKLFYLIEYITPFPLDKARP